MVAVGQKFGLSVTLASLLWLLPVAVFAQDDTTETPATPVDQLLTDESQLVLDPNFIASSRADAMAGAVGTLADGTDAAYHNPAGIGGLGFGKTKLPFLRRFYFPRAYVAANEDSASLISDVRGSDAAVDSAVGAAIVETAANKRQYNRVNAVAGAVFGRMMLIPFSDTQIAAVPSGNENQEIAVRYRSTSGVGFGMSFATSDDSVALGYYGSYTSMSEVLGTMTYSEVVNASTRQETLKDLRRKYDDAIGHNASLNFGLGKKASPRFSILARNIEKTTFVSQDELIEDLVIEEDYGMAFSVSPKLSKKTTWNWVLQVDRLTQTDVTLIEKFRLGTELLIGSRPGSYSTFALRAGYNNAGASFGMAFNLGLVGLELGSYAVDIGPDNSSEAERRYSVTAYTNVAEF